ncbi:hypothetical protein EYZ11_011930 [Aspergillus tanneri]|uniref:Uncharacterized protein n=1 Tax=Aspergillus tanneri TaxID=1220188 RepID=A0A4S3J3N4_9EURO|nr:hypothetical protein EYZ11_011930 [Aspergillus tanneri]
MLTTMKILQSSHYVKKPAGGTIRQCPKYKFIPAGSIRQKKNLPSWATKGNGVDPDPSN